MAVNGQLSSDNTSSVVQTTNGTTPTIIYTTPAFLANDGGQVITFDIVGFDFTNDEIATAKIVVKLKNVGGTPSIVGTPVHLIPFTAASSPNLINCAASVSISGSNLIVRVIGIADRTIDWTCNRFPSLSVLDNWTAVNTPSDGYVNWWKASRSRWEPVSPVEALFGTTVAGGDLTGNYPNPLVDGLTGTNSFNVGNGSTSGVTLQAVTGATGSAYGVFTLNGQASSNGSYAGGSINITGGAGLFSASDGGSINIDAGPGTDNGTINLGGNGSTKWISLSSDDGYKILLGTENESSSSPIAVMRSQTVKLDSSFATGNIQLITNQTTGLITLQSGNLQFFMGESRAEGFEFDFHSDITNKYVCFNGLSSGSNVINQIGTTVGAAGGASALPATPLGYLRVKINGAVVAIPYFNAS
jgi:hypothetical protein